MNCHDLEEGFGGVETNTSFGLVDEVKGSVFGGTGGWLEGLNSSIKMKVRMERDAWSQAWVLHSGAGRCCVPFNMRTQ